MVSITELTDDDGRNGKKGKKSEEKKPLLELSEEEQLRIINETGILHRLKKDKASKPSDSKTKTRGGPRKEDEPIDDGEDDDDEEEGEDGGQEDDEGDEDEDGDPNAEPPTIATAILLTIPLVILHQILDFAVHQQYGNSDDFTLQRMFFQVPPLALALFLIICLTSGPRRNFMLTQFILAVASGACGVMIIKYSEGMETFGNMLKTPGLAALWVYAVIQMKLEVAVASLLVPLAYYFRNSFMGDPNVAKL
ncbi:hypothetical protein HDU97_008690 [Phlyctochytrium planicorne]|nr:hypothetical protein HDU97_008690 [Phlyctochytrium planicorne]